MLRLCLYFSPFSHFFIISLPYFYHTRSPHPFPPAFPTLSTPHQDNVEPQCPTKQSHEQNGNGQHTNDVACCSRIDSSEASGREHNSAQTVQHALSTNRR